MDTREAIKVKTFMACWFIDGTCGLVLLFIFWMISVCFLAWLVACGILVALWRSSIEVQISKLKISVEKQTNLDPGPPDTPGQQKSNLRNFGHSFYTNFWDLNISWVKNSEVKVNNPSRKWCNYHQLDMNFESQNADGMFMNEHNIRIVYLQSQNEQIHPRIAPKRQ